MRQNVVRAALGLSVPLLLFACGQAPTSGAVDPYANGASHPWTYAAPAWDVRALRLTPGWNNLYFEPLLAASNSWGPIEIDRSNGEQNAGDGRTLTLNGKTYARGFGTHASSEMRYSLQGMDGAQCTRFTADIGVDDEVGGRGSVVFQVFLDGIKAYDSGTMSGASATKQVDLDVAGKRELRLVVTDASDGIDYDHADWAQPLIFCQSAQVGGTLDPSFDGDGQVITHFGLARGTDNLARQVIQQPDGKLLAGGTASSSQMDASIVLARYQQDGSLDSSFGVDGRVVTDLYLSDGASLGDLGLQADGSIVISGSLRTGLEDHPFLARYRPDGTFDSGFGNSGRVVVRSVNSPAFATLQVQSDGKIVLGVSNAVQRYHPDGTLDAGFGGGNLTFPQQVFDVVLQADGRVLVLGADGLLRRYTRDGALDSSFGNGGDVTFEGLRRTVQAVRGTSLLVLPSGQLLVGLTAVRDAPGNDPPFDLETYLSRLSPDGRPDASFGEAGFINTNDHSVANLRLQSDGKLLSYPDRYTPDGRLDPTFRPPALPQVAVLDSIIQQDGRIVAAGRQIDPVSKVLNFFLMRLLP